MFNIGFPELLVIFGVALLALGPERLPDLARRLGKLTADLRRQTESLRREFYNEVYKPVDDGTRNFRDASRTIDNSVRDFGRQILEEPPPDTSTKAPLPTEATCEDQIKDTAEKKSEQTCEGCKND